MLDERDLSKLTTIWRYFPHTFAQKASGGRWIPYPYLKLISLEIAKAINKGNGRIIVELPARHGKSELISRWIPTWYLNLFPEKRVILATYEADFAARWGRLVRNEIQSNPLVITKISGDSTAQNRWETITGGGMITAGVGGPITGKGGDLIIIDDVVKNWDEACSETYQRRTIDWFNSTLYTRCEPNASIIVLGTRWNERDLQGYLQTEHQDKWTVIRLPAVAEEQDLMHRKIGDPLCPDRFDSNALARIKKAVGPRVWSALYQQRPSPNEGSLIKRTWWKFWNVLPARFEEKIQSWDLSFSGKEDSDFVVGQVWGRIGANRYLIDQVRARMDFPATIQAVRALSSKHPDAFAKVIEEKANGAALIATLKNELSGLIPVNPRTSKEARVVAISPEIEAGNVYLPDPSIASWVHDFIEETCQFPNGRNDDCVDCMTMALIRLQSRYSGDFTEDLIPKGQTTIAPSLTSGDLW